MPPGFAENAAGQGLVAAMLAPGLGNGFKFDVGWIALFSAKIFLNRFHLCQVKRGTTFFGDGE